MFKNLLSEISIVISLFVAAFRVFLCCNFLFLQEGFMSSLLVPSNCWYLNLKLMSSSTYRAMQTAGYISLSSERTIRDYSNSFTCKPGFQLVNDNFTTKQNLVNYKIQRILCNSKWMK